MQFYQNSPMSNFSNDESNKPRILLMGMSRSGKSSIQRVVFQKMSPSDTLFLESTDMVTAESFSSSFIDFQVWDFPGAMGFDKTELLFGNCGAIVFVIDAQDEYLEAIPILVNTIVNANAYNPDLRIEIFIHKIDGLSEDMRLEILRDIQQRVYEELQEYNISPSLSYHLTSIYDNSIFEAFSRVIQKLIRQLSALENLLDILCANSGIEKAFIFDIASKIYIATDSTSVDSASYELCSDLIDMIVDMTYIYGSHGAVPTNAIVKLNNDTAILFREMNGCLSLLCILRQESLGKQGLVHYNIDVFQQGLAQIFNK